MEQKHTPLPWKVIQNTDESISIHGDGDKHCLRHWGDPLPRERYDANFIVRACNNHYDLIAALEGVIRVADRNTDEFINAKAILSKAKGDTV